FKSVRYKSLHFFLPPHVYNYTTSYIHSQHKSNVFLKKNFPSRVYKGRENKYKKSLSFSVMTIDYLFVLVYSYRQIEKGVNAMRGRMTERRKAAGYTQSDMAGFLGWTAQCSNLIENDRRRPSQEKEQKIGNILGMEWAEFYKED